MTASKKRILAAFILTNLCCIGGRSTSGAEQPSDGQKNSIFDLPVRFTVGEKGFVAIGYIDTKTKTFYVWRDLAIRIEAVPNLGPHHRDPLFDRSDEGFRTEEIDPPIMYVRLTDSTAAPGYIDKGAKVFYQWKDVTIAIKDLPKNVKLQDPATDGWGVVMIPRPTRK